MFLNKTTPTVYKNANKNQTQYWVGSSFSKDLTFHRDLWYIRPVGPILEEKGKKISEFYKQVPWCIYELFDQQMRLHWFIGDEFWESYDRTFHFCTEFFIKEEVDLRIQCLAKLGIKAGSKIRKNKSKCGKIRVSWRIRVSRQSVKTLYKLLYKEMPSVLDYRIEKAKM